MNIHNQTRNSKINLILDRHNLQYVDNIDQKLKYVPSY